MDNTTAAAAIVQWMGAAMVCVFIFVLVRAHFNKEGSINLSMLITEEGKVTLAKFGGLLALLTSTWLVVYLAVDKALTEGIFIGYVVGWGGVKIAADLTNKPAPGTEVEETIMTKTKSKGAPIKRGK